MKLHIEIELDNAVMVDELEQELVRIFNRVVDEMGEYPVGIGGTMLRDSNGNTVGHAWTTED